MAKWQDRKYTCTLANSNGINKAQRAAFADKTIRYYLQ